MAVAYTKGQVKIDWNERAFVDFLIGTETEAELKARAEAVAATARGMAPVGNPGAPQYDPHPGQYRDSIKVTIEHGSRRSRVRIESDVPYAMKIERRARVLGSALRAHQIGY